MKNDSNLRRTLRLIGALFAIVIAPALVLLITLPIFHNSQSPLLAYAVLLAAISVSIWNPLYRLIPNEDARWVARVPVTIFWLLMSIPVVLWMRFLVYGDSFLPY